MRKPTALVWLSILICTSAKADGTGRGMATIRTKFSDRTVNRLDSRL